MCKECEIDKLETRIKQLENQVTSLQTLNTELTLKNRSTWLPTIQIEHKEWHEKQPWANKSKDAGVPLYFEPILGITEESGELSHAFLKLYQGIRGTEAEHLTEAKDAIGDIAIYTIHLCNVMGWDLQTIIHDTWNKVVKKRDWKKDNVSGGEVITPISLPTLIKPPQRTTDTVGVLNNLYEERKAALHHFIQRKCNCHSHLCIECNQRFEVGDHINDVLVNYPHYHGTTGIDAKCKWCYKAYLTEHHIR